jgi:signal transduction histidine kinase
MEGITQTNNFFGLISIGVLVMLALALALVVFFYTAQKKLLQEQMRQQALEIRYREELLYSTIETQEKERHRIAKDLHDEIGSKLNVVFLSLYRLKKQTKAIPSALDTIAEMTDLINKTIGTTRQISHDLLPPTLSDFGLSAAIQELSESYNKTETVEIIFNKNDEPTRIENQLTELNLFRVIQELTKNSVVHGQAKSIQIDLELHPNHFNINYQDNGKGFDLAAMKAKRGLGTQNIESRLKMSNASIQYESSIGNGVKAFISNRSTP